MASLGIPTPIITSLPNSSRKSPLAFATQTLLLLHHSHSQLQWRNRVLVSALQSNDSTVELKSINIEEKKMEEDTPPPPPPPVKLTYLEGNSWLLDVDGINILVDPILVGNLDFGIPWLYDAAKKFLKPFQLKDLPELDFLLITQSLDDHCHIKTLKPLSQLLPELQVVSTPNAEPILSELFKNVTYLEPGESTEMKGRCGSRILIQASAGPVLGPPWQRPENGYFIGFQAKQSTLYIEPHCVYDQSYLVNKKADIIITPVVKQLLPGFTLVSGQEDAIKLAKLLHAKYVVPMKNGDLDAKGLLSKLVQGEGTIESFKDLLSRELPDATLLEPTPGIPLEIPTK